MNSSTNPGRDIYSVSRLNAEIRAVLEGSFPLLWVEGEISNLSTPRSGHSYFSLKDPHAQVRCALFRGKRQLLRMQPKDGDQVLIRARISLYEARGDFQLIVEHMEPTGAGALQRAFEELKNKLEKEGLFDTGRKKPLPAYPQRIGVVTSATGAATAEAHAGMGSAAADVADSREAELDGLRQKATELREQLADVVDRLDRLEKGG